MDYDLVDCQLAYAAGGPPSKPLEWMVSNPLSSNPSTVAMQAQDGLLVYGINALSPASIAHVLSLVVSGVPCAEERNPRSGRPPAIVTPEQVAKVMQSTFTR